MRDKITFKLTVINQVRIMYCAEARSVCITGDKTEYELLPYHSPLIGVLKRSEVVVDHKLAIPLERGLVKFFNNECFILAEEKDENKAEMLRQFQEIKRDV